MSEIRRLTIDQLEEIYGHETDEKGELVPQFEPGPEPPSESEKGIAMLRLKGMSERAARRVWSDLIAYREERQRLDAQFAEEARREADKEMDPAKREEVRDSALERKAKDLEDRMNAFRDKQLAARNEGRML